MIELPINWGEVARIVLLSRELDLFEEKHLAPQGKVKYQFSAKGHELSQALLGRALDHSHDAVTVYYRSRPLLLACGLEPTTALATIIPWDIETVLESVHKTGKALIVHEDTLTSGFGAEISAVITEEVFTSLDAPVQRLATPDIPIPYNVAMMESILPNAEKIRGKIRELLAY